MVSLEEAMLLFRGYADADTPLRVAIRSPEINFSGSCTVHKAESGRVAFWIGDGEDSAIDFLLDDCLFEFRDAPPEAEELPLGKKAESCISVLRRETGFGFIAMPIRDESKN